MSASLTREIHHHRQLHHPNVTQMYEVIATESHIWIVTELCCGGELFDYLAEKGRLSERESSIIFGQLALAVAYLHEKGIVHRDLKLENVLLDERCRVKLGDFGFTREYDRGVYMETFCGTTGYAAPEMLQGKRYLGPEVDVWSMGVILYCLLTGTLPFDDDDEAVMKEKVIKGQYEDPEWLSTDARDLVRSILEVDPAKRLTIPQILASPWFTSTPSAPVSDQVLPGVNCVPLSPSPPRDTFILPVKPVVNTQIQDPFDTTQGNESQATITKAAQRSQHLGKDSMTRQPETVIEEEPEAEIVVPSATGSVTNLDQTPKAPPYPTRTPARTKRRSVSSTLSDPGSPTLDKPLAPLPPQDFASLLSTPAPIIFSTPAERDLLNSLSLLGFDTSQIVHSVLSDACDAAGAIWWMLKRKREKRVLAGEIPLPLEFSDREESKQREKDGEKEDRSDSRRRIKRGIGVQTDDAMITSSSGLIHRAPEFALLPPTPTVPSSARPTTPPRAKSPFLSPSPTTAESSGRSNPSTPNGSFKDKDNKGRRDSKARSGSVSIMQRATNALEIAGLVRKKSSEAVKGEDKDRERERPREHEKRSGGWEEPRNSGNSNSSKLTKSPPLRPKDQVIVSTSPSVAEPSVIPPLPGSPWVVAGGRSSPPQSHASTPANSPGDTLTSLPNFSDEGKVVPPNRNRASLLSAFRLWFQEDKKGKRKEAAPAQGSGRGLSYSRSLAIPPTASMSPGGHGNVKRRGSGTGRGRRVKRHSTSSRRSSSVNSRRSSGNSGQMLVLEPPHVLEQIPSVRSYGGAHTPGSDKGEYSSRPSSIHSITLGKHRKSPSTGSNGSAHYRTGSPMHKYHHRRAGSSSSTRVMRHQAGPRPVHNRTSSATSSVHSLASSRPTSFYEASEGEGTRTSSPYKSYPSRRSLDDTPRRGTGSATFVAQKRTTPFMSPSGTVGRTGWRKSWGQEPPGWRSRSTHLPVEVLSISPGPEGPASIRDVFTGRQSLNLGDESDWVDEDDDIPEFAGGLGQMPSSSSTSSSFIPVESPIPMSPPARNHNSRSKGRATSLAPPNSNNRSKQGNSPARSSPSPTENVFEASDMRAGRRQLPTSRSGPAFKHPIQEEDEEEEE